MKFEVGKTYRTRDGREVKILQNNGGKRYPFVGRVGGEVRTWEKDGSFVRVGERDALDLIAECTDNPWTVCRGADAPVFGVEIKYLDDGWVAWRKREPVRETHTGECWASHYEHVCPSLLSSECGDSTFPGTYTTETVDGKPVRIVWEAD